MRDGFCWTGVLDRETGFIVMGVWELISYRLLNLCFIEKRRVWCMYPDCREAFVDVDFLVDMACSLLLLKSRLVSTFQTSIHTIMS